MEAPNYGGIGSSQPPHYTHEEEAPLLTKDNTAGKYTAEARYNDVWATGLFIANIGAFTALNIYSFRAYASNLADPFVLLDDGERVATNAFMVDHSLSILALSSIVVSFALSFGYFLLIQRHTAFLVKFSFLVSVFLTLALGVLQIMAGSLFWGLVSVLAGLAVLFLYKYWASRMQLSVHLLQTAAAVTRKYPGTLAVSLSCREISLPTMVR